MNIGNSDDCAKQALEENKVTLKKIAYDEAANEITVSVKYTVVNVDIVLTQTASGFEGLIKFLQNKVQ